MDNSHLQLAFNVWTFSNVFVSAAPHTKDVRYSVMEWYFGSVGWLVGRVESANVFIRLMNVGTREPFLIISVSNSPNRLSVVYLYRKRKWNHYHHLLMYHMWHPFFFFHSRYKIVSSSKRFLVRGISEQYVLLLHLSWFFCRKFNEKPLHLLGWIKLDS